MRLKIYNSLICLCVATVAVSCSDALVDDVNMRPVGGEESDMISFVVANNNTTRGGSFGNRPCGGAFLRTSDGTDSLYMKAEVADMDALSTRAEEFNKDNQPKSLFMTCRVRTNGKSYYHYFENERFDKNDEGVWSSNPPRWWLSNDTFFNFYGYYAPDEVLEKENPELKFHGNSDNVVPIPTLDYTIPSNISEHFDLVYSSNASTEFIANHKQLVSLPMKHALVKVAFKVGTLPNGKEIENISIINVNNGGTLDLGTGDWTVTSTGEYTTEKWLIDDEEDAITGDNCFMVLPGDIADNVYVSVKVLNEEKPYTFYIKNVTTKWEAGKKYIYTLTIEEDVPNLNITLDDNVFDAHYLIAQAYIDASELGDDQTWEVEVSAEGVGENDANNQPSIILSDNLTDFQKEGYWIDKVYSDAACTKFTRSERGSQSLGGSKGTSIPVSLFIPENNSENDREILIELKVNGTTVNTKTVVQKCPGWTNSNYGWEQIEDSEGEFGFNWTRVVYYGYKYDSYYKFVIVYTDFLKEHREYCQKIIDENNASNYAVVETYKYDGVLASHTRTQIKIDYNYFSNLPGCNPDNNDGWQNTVELYNLSGQSSIGSFEETIKQIRKASSDTSTDRLAFDIGDGDSHGTIPSGFNSPNSTAIAECLKKNRFNLYETIESDGATEQNIVSIPIIREEEIVWYMPAVNQFDNIPSNLVNPIDNKGLYWSSTAVIGDGDIKYAKLGNGDPGNRLDKHNVRACRKR